jgi:hypothetical protein
LVFVLILRTCLMQRRLFVGVELAVEHGVDMPASNHKFSDTYEKARIACATALQLNGLGMQIEVEDEDVLFAQRVIKNEVKPTTQEIFKPGSAIQLGAILKEYDVQVARDAAQLRTVATNKLIEMLDDPDPKVRLKSIELIGKIADVGLFAERTEITINTKSTADLENELSKLLGDVIDVEATETVEEEEEEGKNGD